MTDATRYQAPMIRKAQLTDANSIAELGAHVFTTTFAHSVQPQELRAFLDESYTVAAIIKDLQDLNRDVILSASREGEILGFAYLTRGSSEPCVADVPDKVELQRIYVHPSAHGKGVGRLLANTLEEMAREQGFKSMWLGVWEENTRAIKAYQKWGYKLVGDHDFVIGTVIQTDFIMLKSL
ncbi:acyl-CoA N-acyltransferase [Truncatella angustata]|uniref:Acyl-CoA N-acyltransferase n=1 Tax=Truncatella angustata TaxID=152316 RepID=A0A9P8ZVX0_9PEZI|nr:acyl-CoA N-acyltransferase [Truncatella angustata]KAH6652366.1 acyl-CoA N-acyltransferase [Truncatella angustata]